MSFGARKSKGDEVGEFRWFSPKARLALEQASWEIVQVPGILIAPVTLNKLFLSAEDFGAKFATSWHGDLTRGDIGHFPLSEGEIAWMPKDPLIPGSLEKTFAEQEKLVEEFSRQIQEQFGDSVKATFPVAEQVVLVLFDHHRRTGKRVLPVPYTRTLNDFRSDRFKIERKLRVGHFGEDGLRIGVWYSKNRNWRVGVLRLLVPGLLRFVS